MENIGEISQTYWESILQIDDYSWGGLEETFSGYYDSSSPDGSQSAAASRNTLSERNRRKKLNDRLFALRAVVPNITKMDKASIIKDAIEYIKVLNDEERAIQAELVELGSVKLESNNVELCEMERSKKKRAEQAFDPIEIMELNVAYVKEKMVVVSLNCWKRRDTIVKLCEVFESLKLNVVTANISVVSDRLFTTLFIQGEEEEMDVVKMQIETAINAFNHSLTAPTTM